MLRHLFAHPWLLLALAALPALSLLGVWARWKRSRAVSALGDRVTVEGQLAVGRWGRRLRGPLLSLGLAALGLGLAGPRWGRDWEEALTPGRDLIVVLDVSRSMLAEQPSRLERARAALLDLARTLRRRGGHRVALVAFAGQPRLLCPLTHDYDHFTELVEGLDGEILGSELGPSPGAVSGTRIGAGLLEGLATLDPLGQSHTDLLLISDGDDPARDGEWREAVAAVRAAEIPVHVLGPGQATVSARIPVKGGWLSHEGGEVRTRLREVPLREIAEKTGGRLELTGSRDVALGELYLGLIASGPRREADADAVPTYHPRHLWFLVPAFGLLLVGLALPDRPAGTARDLVRRCRELFGRTKAPSPTEKRKR